MDRPRLPLGEYVQLLLKNGLLADNTPLSTDFTRRVEAVTCDSRGGGSREPFPLQRGRL